MVRKEDFFWHLLERQLQQAMHNLEAFASFKQLPRVVQAQIRRLNHKLRRIEAALSRWQEGQYGICQSCFATINHGRLTTFPYTELCLECQQAQEKENAYELKYSS